MSSDHPAVPPVSPSVAVPACDYRDPGRGDVDEVIPLALEHFAAAGRFAVDAVGRRGLYGHQHAIDALHRAVATAAGITGALGPDIAGFWAAAGATLADAEALLHQAAGLLSAARDQIVLPTIDDIREHTAAPPRPSSAASHRQPID